MKETARNVYGAVGKLIKCHDAVGKISFQVRSQEQRASHEGKRAGETSLD